MNAESHQLGALGPHTTGLSHCLLKDVRLQHAYLPSTLIIFGIYFANAMYNVSAFQAGTLKEKKIA